MNKKNKIKDGINTYLKNDNNNHTEVIFSYVLLI